MVSKFITYKYEKEALQDLRDNYSDNDQEVILKGKKRLNLLEDLLVIGYLIYLLAIVVVCVHFGIVAQRGIEMWQFEYIDTFIQVVKYCIISAPVALVLVIVATEVSERTIGKKWIVFYNDYLSRRTDSNET